MMRVHFIAAILLTASTSVYAWRGSGGDGLGFLAMFLGFIGGYIAYKVAGAFVGFIVGFLVFLLASVYIKEIAALFGGILIVWLLVTLINDLVSKRPE